MIIAITRDISPAINECELTHLAREPIDLATARAQHRQYIAALQQLGCEVLELPAEPDLPDSVFVEDTAVVLDEAAIITRPGAPSRRPETESVARALAAYRRLLHITAPGTLDGGDVLRVGRKIFIGLSSRSNQAGIEQMGALLAPFGYSVISIRLNDCLHLKSAVTQVAPGTLLINPRQADAAVFSEYELIEVDESEPAGANALLVNEAVICPAHFPATRRRLEERGLRVIPVEASELAKAEGGVTCCSLLLNL
ncbi:MAG TPA: arginine deiminase family protein [Blastocatellia bacterium]|nr:arginine deiminase family protein [Blastocatellia bacterium]